RPEVFGRIPRNGSWELAFSPKGCGNFAVDSARRTISCMKAVHDQPRPISQAELQARIRRITEIADGFVFTGDVEYRHVYSGSGGAQYGIGPSAAHDIMGVYAEAFERDIDPDDFHLEALIAHECGHQRLHRKPKLRPVLANFGGEEFEEILASLVGSILLGESESSQALAWKATAELTDLRLSVQYA